ncbi:MAG: response regulator [Planctomycetota bacterium]
MSRENGARILLVEDNAMNRRLVRDLLVHRGHVIIEATTVAEARELLAGEPDVDLVLMDLQLPDGSGQDVLGSIRERADLRSLPVLAVTASAMQGEKERLLAAGFDAYLSKPIDTRAFGPVVESFLVKGAQGRD